MRSLLSLFELGGIAFHRSRLAAAEVVALERRPLKDTVQLGCDLGELELHVDDGHGDVDVLHAGGGHC